MLSSHVDSELVTRNDLVKFVPPPSTSSHTTIAHSKLVDVVEESLAHRHLQVAKSEFAVSNDEMRLFGVLTLRSEVRSDYSFNLGLRTSNDKTIPVQMIAGATVFVCDNMAFSGELIVFSRRHTSRIDIKTEIASGVDRAVQKYIGLETRINEMKSFQVKDAVAKGVILDAAVNKIMPLHLIPNVYQEYFEPKHDEFKERNLWSLHNAFTESFKLLKAHVAMQANVELGQFFKM